MDDVLIELSPRPFSKGLPGEPFCGIPVEDTHASVAGLFMQTGPEQSPYRPFKGVRIGVFVTFEAATT